MPLCQQAHSNEDLEVRRKLVAQYFVLMYIAVEDRQRLIGSEIRHSNLVCLFARVDTLTKPLG